MGFKVLVTVTPKNAPTTAALHNRWNRVLLGLEGDKDDLLNVIEQFRLVKSDVNADMNREGLALRDVDIKFEFV